MSSSSSSSSSFATCNSSTFLHDDDSGGSSFLISSSSSSLNTSSSSSSTIDNNNVNSVNNNPFETTLMIERFHRWTPRFGHSKDIQTHLIEGTNEQQTDYLQGLLAASAAVFVLVCLWTILLIILQYCSCCCNNNNDNDTNNNNTRNSTNNNQQQTTTTQTPPPPPPPSKTTSGILFAIPLGRVHRNKVIKPMKPTIGKPKRKMPFQHNGVAAGYDASNTHGHGGGVSSPLAKITKVIPKPLSAARQRKRQIEAQVATNSSSKMSSSRSSGRKKRKSGGSRSDNKYFSKMKSSKHMDMEDMEDDNDNDNNDRKAPPTPLETALGNRNHPYSPGGGAEMTVPTEAETHMSPITTPSEQQQSVTGGGATTAAGSTVNSASFAGSGAAGSGAGTGGGGGASVFTENNMTVISSSNIAMEIQLEKEKRLTWDQYYDDLDTFQDEIDRQTKCIYRIRLMIMFCLTGIIISSILFVVMTMGRSTQGGLNGSILAFQDGIQQLSSICQDTSTVIQNYQQRQIQVLESTQKFILEVNEICPASGSTLCTNVTVDQDRYCDFSRLPNTTNNNDNNNNNMNTNVNNNDINNNNDLGMAFIDLFRLFQIGLTNIFQNLNQVQQDLEDVIVLLNQAEEYYPKHFSWTFWVAAGSSIALSTLCLYLLGIIIRLLYYTDTEMMSIVLNNNNNHHQQQQQKSNHHHHDNDDDNNDDDDNSSTDTTSADDHNNNNNDSSNNIKQQQQQQQHQMILPLSVRRIRSWVVVPLLLLMTIVSWLFSMMFITGAIGTADLCINSPDGPMLSILQQIRQKEDFGSSLVPMFLEYYIRGCPSISTILEQQREQQQRNNNDDDTTTNSNMTMAPTFPSSSSSSSMVDIFNNNNDNNNDVYFSGFDINDLFLLDQQFGVLSRSVLPAIDELIQVVNDPFVSAAMASKCASSSSNNNNNNNNNSNNDNNNNYLMPFLAITKALQAQICVLTATLYDIRELLSCSNWYPLYEETVHVAICYYATSGLGWAATTQFVIVVLVFIILTLRVGYYEYDELINPTSTGTTTTTMTTTTNTRRSGRKQQNRHSKKGTKLQDDDDNHDANDDEKSTSED